MSLPFFSFLTWKLNYGQGVSSSHPGPWVPATWGDCLRSTTKMNWKRPNLEGLSEPWDWVHVLPLSSVTNTSPTPQSWKTFTFMKCKIPCFSYKISFASSRIRTLSYLNIAIQQFPLTSSFSRALQSSPRYAQLCSEFLGNRHEDSNLDLEFCIWELNPLATILKGKCFRTGDADGPETYKWKELVTT